MRFQRSPFVIRKITPTPNGATGREAGYPTHPALDVDRPANCRARTPRQALGTEKIFPMLASSGTVAELFSLLGAHELRAWPRRPAN
ncbi:hypothetical protein [Streptomyces sp. NPDC048496]|uniref:hypothetical protein n=1 Tax=Streptomyces sp. NPDC048496 TaxID=3365558 RepID=UPI0037122A6F